MNTTNNRAVTWQSFGIQHTAEFRTRDAGDRVAIEARVNNGPWHFFCFNIDEKNAVSVGEALVNRIAIENGWRDDEVNV